MFLSFWIGLMGFVEVIVLLRSFPCHQIGVEGVLLVLLQRISMLYHLRSLSLRCRRWSELISNLVARTRNLPVSAFVLLVLTGDMKMLRCRNFQSQK